MAYTTIDNPELYFQCKTYTGNGNDDRDIVFDVTDTTMQPNFLWSARRDSGDNLSIYDSVRGDGKELRTAETGAEYDRSDNIQALNSNGFQVGTDSQVNANTGTYVSWAWKAGTTSGIAGSADITPNAYSFNQTAGFSIVTYNGTDVNGDTVLHGLGAVPYFMIVKRRVGSGYDWVVYHKDDVAGLYLNTTSNNNDSSGTNIWFHGQTPTSTQFHIGTDGRIGDNVSTGAFVAYLWSEVKGYSKFTSFTGNGNADGPFVYLGFRAAFVIIKRTDASANWQIYDNKRDGYNGAGYPAKGNESLRANETHAESTATGYDIDILSNGIKLRNTNSTMNSSGATHIVMAFAESPFVNSNGVPTTAR